VTRLLAVVRRDLASLWTSPLPWVAGAAFQSLLGLLVVDQLAVRRQAVVQPLFPIAGLLLVVVVPVVTMRAFAEESRTGSLDLLLAVPVPPAPLVVGKWLAGWLTTLALVAPAAAHAGLAALWGNPDTGPVVAGFAGLALLAAALTGIGVLASSATASPPVAALAAGMAGLVLWFAGAATGGAGTGLLATLSLSERLRTFAAGAVDTGDVVFLAAVVAGTLVVAATVLDLRRLR
jgi:ABC-2 type transport system permease protein